MAKQTSDAPGAVEVRFNEQADQYELGADHGGTWVSFVAVPGASIRAAQENTAANTEAEQAS